MGANTLKSVAFRRTAEAQLLGIATLSTSLHWRVSYDLAAANILAAANNRRLAVSKANPSKWVRIP
jgi:hypothetical protein